MITGKQRSYLKKLGQQLSPTVFLGKAGLTDSIRQELENGFESRELVKVKLQESSQLDARETANQLASELGAEFVQAIGRKFILYRASTRKRDRIQLP